MPRHEPTQQTNHRRELLHFLTLAERSCREAREFLCLSDELAEVARVPTLVLAGRLPKPQDGQAAKIQMSQELRGAHAGQIRDFLSFAARVTQLVSEPAKQEPEKGESNGCNHAGP